MNRCKNREDVAPLTDGYLTQAATVLPDLVAALELLLADQRRPKSELSRGQFEFCESALARAKLLERGAGRAQRSVKGGERTP